MTGVRMGRCHTVISTVWTTRWRSCRGLIVQPTTSPEYKSSTTHGYNQCSAVRTYVISVTHLVLGAVAGLREGEAVALKPEDVDLRQSYLIVRRNFTAGRMAETPKNGKSRKVDLSQDLVQVLREHMAIRSAEAAMTNLRNHHGYSQRLKVR